MTIQENALFIEQSYGEQPEPPLPDHALVAEQYLNGLRDLYKNLGRCSCSGDDLQLVLPEGHGIASVSYIGGIVMLASRADGMPEVFSIDDDGLVNLTSIPETADSDIVTPASMAQVSGLFSRSLAGASLA